MSARVHTFAALLGAALLASVAASAHSTGIVAQGCDGCHSGGTEPMVQLTASTAPTLGGTVTLHVAIQAVNGPVGGLYLLSSGPGSLQTITGQGTRQLTEDDITHSTPRAASSGQVTFDVLWNAPATPGGVDFDVWALSANNNRASSGDGPGHARLNLVFGCAGTTYYRDMDRDGYGDPVSGTTRNCSVPTGYVARAGDCNDNNEMVHPGVAEICNRVDDDCNGSIDDGLPSMTYYPDEDHDGHGGSAGTPVMGCAAPVGYGVGNDDCDDTHATVYRGAPELCDGRDNDCNGRVDDGARATCGVGWCARTAPSCATVCTPGRPSPETCNLLDDDCDGVVDNGTAMCPASQSCVMGACVAERPDAGVLLDASADARDGGRDTDGGIALDAARETGGTDGGADSGDASGPGVGMAGCACAITLGRCGPRAVPNRLAALLAGITALILRRRDRNAMISARRVRRPQF